MTNTFTEIEDNLFFRDDIMFDESKIKNYILEQISKKLNSVDECKKHFLFEEIVCEFFDYLGVEIIKTKKTRDFGIDGVIKLSLELLGDISLGLQVKDSLIDSNDIDVFTSALRNAELQLGVIVCKDSRKLVKYELDSKIRAILFSRGIKIKEKLIKESIDINPIFIMKMEDLIDIVASKMRSTVRMIYKE